MKKTQAILFLVLAIAALAAGCTDSPAAPENKVIKICVTMNRNDYQGWAGEALLAYAQDHTGAMLTNAAVSFIGPDGIIGSPAVGMFVRQLNTADDFQFGAQYAVSVTVNAVNYYGTFISNGDITIAPDGSSVSWPYAADSTEVMMSKIIPLVIQTFTPSSSPFDANATGLYTIYGAGTYTIQVTNKYTKALTFTVDNVVGIASFKHYKTYEVTK